MQMTVFFISRICHPNVLLNFIKQKNISAKWRHDFMHFGMDVCGSFVRNQLPDRLCRHLDVQCEDICFLFLIFLSSFLKKVTLRRQSFLFPRSTFPKDTLFQQHFFKTIFGKIVFQISRVLSSLKVTFFLKSLCCRNWFF